MRLIPIAASLLALLLAQPAKAQEQRGAIEGTVQDAQHAMLPGASAVCITLAGAAMVQVVIDEADYYAGRANVSAAFDDQQLPRDRRVLQYEFFQEPIRARIGVRFSF